MNFVKTLEEQLRDLSISSRRKNSSTHPAIKEAAERAILSLRSLQNSYVVAVRQASRSSGSIQHPTTALFKSQDVLRPFLMAMNHRDCGNNIVNLTLDGMQQLLRGDAVCCDDGINIVRVLNIQASVCATAVEKSGSHSSVMGIGGMNSGMVSAGVGAVSSFGNSLLSGFGILGSGISNNINDQEHQQGQHGSTRRHSTTAVTPQAHSSNRSLKEDEAISIRILQTLVMIVSSESLNLTEELFSSCISICLLFGFLHNEECVNLGMGLKGSSGIGKKKDTHDHHSNTSNNIPGGGGESVMVKVSRAAIATLRQILSTVFDRAAASKPIEESNDDSFARETEEQSTDENLKYSKLQVLASKTLIDLCDLSDYSRGDSRDQICTGPFCQAMTGQQHRIHPPPLSVCFDLIEMIVEQQVDFFVNSKDFDTGRIGIEHDEEINFSAILRDRLCPIVRKKLSFGLNIGADDESFPNSSNKTMISVVIKTTSLAFTIVNSYGALEPMTQECYNILVSMAKLIDTATNLLRDSHEFEDGFVYTNSPFERDEDDTKNDSATHFMDDDKSSQTMWGAAISIELIYLLILDHFPRLSPLLSKECEMNGEGMKTSSLISILIGSVCDFAVVASSCKKAISQVVEATMDKENIAAKKNVNDANDIFQFSFGFNVDKIHPMIVSNARELSEYDIGATVWVALNSILMLWKSLSIYPNKEDNQRLKKLIEGCFAPSLATIQHFLRRCPASDVICKSALSGYLCLARCVLPLCEENDFHRQVVLTSICKLAVPSEDESSTSIVENLNAMAIIAMFNLLEKNANDIGTDWPIIVSFLSQLSRLSLGGETSYNKMIASNVTRVGLFSKRLNHDCLARLTSSLIHFTNTNVQGINTVYTVGNEFYSSTRKKIESTKLSTSAEEFQRLPFSIVLLIDISTENADRFDYFGQETMQYFSDQAASSGSENTRSISLDVLSYYIITHLIKNEGEASRNRFKSVALIEPLCHCISQTSLLSVAELGLTKLKSIVEDGYNVSDAWLIIIDTLSTIAAQKTEGVGWGSCCSIGFGCLKLIVDDFLNDMPGQEETRIALLDCCACFGSSRYDVNTSLTAVGMIWTIADQDSPPSAVDHVLSKLAVLAFDDRVEVRNCVVYTLFSCVVGLGQKFTIIQWEGVFNQTIFAILNRVNEKNDTKEIDDSKDSSGTKQSERYKVSVHHSRDSTTKQWTTTQVLTLRGIERVLRLYFDKLLGSSASSELGESSEIHAWFAEAWGKIVTHCFECAKLMGGRETLDLRLAGVDLLVLCCQASSLKGYIAGDARVSTSMQVVNGALRTVRPSTNTQNSPSRANAIESDPTLVEGRHQLFKKSIGMLMHFADFLRENKEVIASRDTGYVESINLQVLTKLSQGLAKIYDSCKDRELSPYDLSGDSAESEFVDLISLIAKVATGGPSAKYLTQAQKPCLDLLKTMSLQSSSLAFEILVGFGCTSVFGQQVLDGKDTDILDIEAAKLISEVCANEDVNVVVRRLNGGLTATIELPGVSNFQTDEAGQKDVADERSSDKLDRDESGLAKTATEKKENPESNITEKYANLKEHSDDLEADTEIQVEENDSIATTSDSAETCISNDFSTENCQLREVNSELMRQLVLLKSEKEKLEQQVAVLSEGSTYL